MTQNIAPTVFGGGPAPTVFSPPPTAPVLPQGQAPDLADQTLGNLFAKDANARKAGEAKAVEQARLESEHSAVTTAATQAARGVLDVVLAPGALAGMLAEGVGAASGWKGMEDFGRGLGKAASGQSAMEVLGATPDAMAAVFGGGNQQRALSKYEQAQKDLTEQQEAWPLLSTVAHGVGLVGGAAATGGLAGAAGDSSVLGRIAMGATEGSAQNVQAAYEQNQSLRDVLSSAVVGALVGGGVTGAGEAVSYGLKARALSKAARAEADEALPAAVSMEQAGGREAHGVLSDLEKLRKTTDDAVKNVPNFASDEVRQATIKEAQENAVQDLAKKAGSFDPKSVLEKTPNSWQKILHRPEILDEASSQLSDDVARATQLRPASTGALDPARLGKLLKDADGPEALGSLQRTLNEGITDVPKTPGGDQLGVAMRKAVDGLQKADLPAAMAKGHELVQTLREVAENAPDELTKGWAGRQAANISENLGSEPWGKAGSLYKRLTPEASQPFEALVDKDMLRTALRDTEIRGRLPGITKQYANSLADAYDAKRALTGEAAPKGIAQSLKNIESRFAKAEEAVTLDGGPINRVFDHFKNKASGKVADLLGTGAGYALGGAPGAYFGHIVSKAIEPVIKSLAPIVTRGAVSAAKAAAPAIPSLLKASVPIARLSVEDQQKQYERRMDQLTDHVVNPNPDQLEEATRGIPNLTTGQGAVLGQDYNEKVSNLLNDMPRPAPSIKGKAWETLSSDDLRKANAMWEATMKPMSIFSDFRRGNVDYDKVQYAWKQYPGLKVAAQAGVIDLLQTQIKDKERAKIPDSTLTQLDYLFGFNGALQSSLNRDFASRMSAIGQQEAEKKQSPPGGQLNLPTAKPTFTQRMMGVGKS